MKNLKITTFLLIIILAFGCDKDDGSSNTPSGQDPNTFVENFGNETSRNFLGTVIDKNKNPIENVSITIGSLSALTDSNGVFIIQDAQVYERFGYVKAEKTGYISGSRSVVPSSGTNKVTIMLLEETVAGTTSSGTVETIALTNGASVALAGDYITEDGSAYSGSVNVVMHHLDPTDEDMADQMPGMLYAANAQNEEQMLKTFGMLAVELQGSAGEKLNLAEGSTAEITVPLDATLLADAPSSIPLWYFDETHGYWVEEGEATLVGNAYVGTVSHFSFWNCDIPTDAITLCVTVTDVNGAPLTDLWVTITSSTFGTTGGYTNNIGHVCGFVPSNESLEINVYLANTCNEIALYNQIIGPFTNDDSLAVIISSSIDLVSETVVGIFNTCEDNPVTNGYIGLRYAHQSYIDIVTDGAFEINLLRCEIDNTFKIKASDYVSLQVTDSINYTFTTPLTNTGTLNACNAVTEFIQYTIDDGDEHIFIDNFYASIYDDVADEEFSLLTIGSLNFPLLSFDIQGKLRKPITAGTYDNLDFTDVIDTGFSIGESDIDLSDTNNNIIYNFTAFGEIGAYIDINFSGDYEDRSGNPHTISGVVHVLRDN